jgi:hypothetical protein
MLLNMKMADSTTLQAEITFFAIHFKLINIAENGGYYTQRTLSSGAILSY